eukprot:s2077_g9.t1
MSAITDHVALAPEVWQSSLQCHVKVLYQEWCLLKSEIEQGKLGADATAFQVFESLLKIPTLWEATASGAHDALIKQAFRQNVKGSFIKPLNVVQWFDIVLVAAYPGGDVEQLLSFENPLNRKDVGKRLVKTFEILLAGFESKVNAEGIVVGQQQATKRRRVKRTSESGKQDSNADVAVKDREIKIGTQKQNAIKHMCNYCTFESYRALQCHLSFFSESSVNESVLSWKHLWTTTPPADGMCPSEAEEYARRAGAAASAKLVPPRLMCLCYSFQNCPRSKQLEFGGELSPADHNLIMEKLISIHEDTLSNNHGCAKITVDTLWTYRFVVSSWTRTIAECCSTDLKPPDFENVRDAALDSQIKTCIKQWPMAWNVTMLPDVAALATDQAAAHEDKESLVETAEKEEWIFGKATCRGHCGSVKFVLSYDRCWTFGHCAVTGVEQTVVLATMASRSKEESNTDPLEDFVDFCRSMKLAGFAAQIPWHQSLSVPGEECLGFDQVPSDR